MALLMAILALALLARASAQTPQNSTASAQTGNEGAYQRTQILGPSAA